MEPTQVRDLSPGEQKEWKQRLLRQYLRNFFSAPLPREQMAALGEFFKGTSGKPVSVVTPDDTVMKQVGMCYLLSFGGEKAWRACSGYELVQSHFDKDEILTGMMSADLAIIFHGFDTMPNKMIPEIVNQVVMTRKMRGKGTLVLVRTPDVSIEVHSVTLSGILKAKCPSAVPAKSAKVSKAIAGLSPKTAVVPTPRDSIT